MSESTSNGKEALRQIIEGLEGVTPSPWHEDGRNVFIDTRSPVCCGRGALECCGNPDAEGDYYAIAEGGEKDIPHIARCHPDAMRAIAEYVEGLEKERDRFQRERDYAVRWGNKSLDAVKEHDDAIICRMQAALEKCQKALAAMIDPSCIAQSTVLNAFAMATEAEAAARAALSLPENAENRKDKQ